MTLEGAMMFPPRPTVLLQQILAGLLCEGDRVIDATAGNGHDTQFLAECVGATGKVLAFDVQPAAIASARTRIEQAGFSDRVEFIQESHEELGKHAQRNSIDAVMFNLGYLPGEDHACTTEAAITLAALAAAIEVLKADGGVLTIICYPGHAAGADEAVAVEAWMERLAVTGWRVAKYGTLYTRRPAPFLLIARNNRNARAKGC